MTSQSREGENLFMIEILDKQLFYGDINVKRDAHHNSCEYVDTAWSCHKINGCSTIIKSIEGCQKEFSPFVVQLNDRLLQPSTCFAIDIIHNIFRSLFSLMLCLETPVNKVLEHWEMHHLRLWMYTFYQISNFPVYIWNPLTVWSLEQTADRNFLFSANCKLMV